MDGVFVVLFYKVVILQICRGEQRSPAFVFPRIFRYSHILYAFTNHVGDGVLDVPSGGNNAVVVISLMPNYSGYFIMIFFNNSTGEEYRAVEDASPYNVSGKFYRRKIAPLGADFYFILVHNYGQLCPFLTPHSSLLTPNSSLKTTFSSIPA